MGVPGYRYLLEGLIMTADFTITYNDIKPSLIALQEACNTILNDQSLAQFLRFILDTGNFLNAVIVFSICYYVFIQI